MPKIFREHLSRSFAKALSFRLLVIISNTLILFFVTGEVKIVFEIVLISTIANTLIYILHERAWDRVHWGRSHK